MIKTRIGVWLGKEKNSENPTEPKPWNPELLRKNSRGRLYFGWGEVVISKAVWDLYVVK